MVEFDALSLKILNRWPLAPGQRPNGLAIDAKNRRLFSGCNGNSKMVVMDADKGTVIATVDIGRGSDGCGFDPAKGLAYSSNGGDGTVTIIGEPEPGKFKVVATVPTQATALMMIIDPKTHRLYLSAATPVPAPAGAEKKGGRRGNVRGNVPGSVAIIVVVIDFGGSGKAGQVRYWQDRRREKRDSSGERSTQGVPAGPARTPGKRRVSRTTTFTPRRD